ncbi:MAG: homocysteine S-methyltransferase family protein [Clostridia bacterium]|nr:homocysteine S-methyltransferase family protein [Clostridia bacterium]
MTFSELLKKDFVLLDGGFGTELIKRGKTAEEDSALSVFMRPDDVKAIHRSYVDAGSDIIMADTFSANRYKLQGKGKTVEEAIEQALKLAKEAVENTEVLVGLDVSTLGKILEPVGDITYEEAYDAFKEIVICGEKYGADVICLETFTDLREARIALLAAKENTSLPVTASLSFNENGTTMNGNTPGAAVLALTSLGVSAVGVNCALGPDKLEKIVEEILEYSTVPVIVKPNAGLPDPETNEYSETSEGFSEIMKEYYKKGAKLLGGCCGTTPGFIKELKSTLENVTKEQSPVTKNAISGTGKAVTLEEPRIIGERINPTGKKKFKEALQNNDIDYIVNQGLEQVSAGADILDVNVGHTGINEKEMMVKVIKALQATVSVPLQIDSTNPEVIEAALRVYTGKAIVNSVNAEEKSLNEILPIVKKYGASVVGLTLDENGIPEKAEGRVQLAEKIVARAEKEGIKKDDVYIDCLTLTVSANGSSAKCTLNALKAVKEKLNVKTVLGVSNISFGLPKREIINTAFLTLALENGLDLPIINPNTESMSGAIRAYKVLKEIDENCSEYIASAANTETAVLTSHKEISLSEAVEKGLSEEAVKITEKLLAEKQCNEIINDMLIPALDKIGAEFEKGKLFLPQLILSAEAAGACFEVIKAKMKESGAEGESKGTVIIATVKGDVHDIGKNIVKTVLENYGYTVIDLGKDVEPQKVVDAQKEYNAELVGLSALMTTTLGAMEETIALLKKKGAECKVMVGGAVLTPEYAKKIGADFYAKDAKEAADIVKKFFN